MSKPFRSGFVSLLGRPNAGKSTLLNALVGTKVAIVADKPQTTRTTIQGVMHAEDAQVVFIDTPGIHRADSPINKRMMESVREALDQRDLLIFVADATRPFSEPDNEAVSLVRKADTPTLLALNKIDRLDRKEALLEAIDRYRAAFEFAEYFPISATRGEGVSELRQAIVERLPEGPPYFPEDHITDQPERYIATELVREKLLHATHEEVPHSIAVLIDRWEDAPEITRIYASIVVEREGQKKIVIGARGAVIKQAGTLARLELEKILGRRVFLDLHVKVHPGWREKPAFLNAIDWRTMAGKDDS